MRNGFKVIDSELHLMEPLDLWDTRLPEPYRSRTRVIRPGTLSDRLRVDYGNGLVHDGVSSEIRGLMKRHNDRRMSVDPRLAYAARNCRPDVWLDDMDLEGIDVAVL